jgi:hypothetical protein
MNPPPAAGPATGQSGLREAHVPRRVSPWDKPPPHSIRARLGNPTCSPSGRGIGCFGDREASCPAYSWHFPKGTSSGRRICVAEELSFSIHCAYLAIQPASAGLRSEPGTCLHPAEACPPADGVDRLIWYSFYHAFSDQIKILSPSVRTGDKPRRLQENSNSH